MLYPKKDVVRRYKGNPILGPDSLPYSIQGIYNSGAAKYKDRYIMLLRVESIDITNYFFVAESRDGYDFKVRKEPIELIGADEEYRKYTNQMIYDPRITKIGNTYYITFACHSSWSVRIGMIKTEDFEKFHWVDFLSEVDNRNCALFPEKIGGLYARLDRPILPNDHGDIWISYSPDLIFWGKSKCIMKHGEHGGWNWIKIGPGAPPIRTDKGWLEIWHGVHQMCKAQYVYHLGAMLLDLKDPSKVLACTKAPILSPVMDYERIGISYGVTFTSGAILEDNGEVKIYYGGGDTYQCVGTSTVDELIDACYNR